MTDLEALEEMGVLVLEEALQWAWPVSGIEGESQLIEELSNIGDFIFIRDIADLVFWVHVIYRLDRKSVV